MYYTYMLRCENNSIYTGITTDVKRRMEEHFSKDPKCAKYTKSHKAKKLECVWESENKVLASKLEYRIKALTKIQKEELIRNHSLEKYLAEKIECERYKLYINRGGIIMNGNEKFMLNNKNLDFGIFDFWQYKYSNIYNMQEVIAEFIVEKALGLNESHNTDYWTLFDILYRNYRIEVKETGYYHPWNENRKISKQRTFSITKANSNYESINVKNKFERQNDIYIFCLNTGTTKESSNPMNLNNWEFYIVPTSTINEECGNNKTISLNRVKKLTEKVPYEKIKETIDSLINIKDGSNNDKLENNLDEQSIKQTEEKNNLLIDEIDRMENELWKGLFLERLKGKTLVDIGTIYSLSKERVSKIINKIISEMKSVKEDSYRNIFEEYFIEEGLFCEIFNEQSIVYEYLNLKYKIGYNNLEALYYSNKLNAEQNNKLKDYLKNTNKKLSNDNWQI